MSAVNIGHWWSYYCTAVSSPLVKSQTEVLKEFPFFFSLGSTNLSRKRFNGTGYIDERVCVCVGMCARVRGLRPASDLGGPSSAVNTISESCQYHYIPTLTTDIGKRWYTI